MLPALCQVPLCSPCPDSLNRGKETAHRRLSEGLSGAHQSCHCCSRHRRGPSCIPSGQVMENLLIQLGSVGGRTAAWQSELFSQGSSGSEKLPELSYGWVWLSVWACEQKGANVSASLLSASLPDPGRASSQWFKFSDVPFLLLASAASA